MSIEPPRSSIALLIAALATACSSADEPTNVEPTLTPGVIYTAATTESRFEGRSILLVTLSIENTSTAPVTLTYTATCPIRIRLYQPADNALVYDETRVPCASSGLTTMTISPRDTRSIGSGFRGMTGIVGDSLRFATYRVFAVPQIEGAQVEIPAGSITLKQ